MLGGFLLARGELGRFGFGRLGGLGAAGNGGGGGIAFRRGGRGGRGDGGGELVERDQEVLDAAGGFGLPSDHLRPGAAGNVQEQIHAVEKGVNIVAAQLDFALLGGDKTVFHGMGDRTAASMIDDARGTLEGMGGAHEHFELGARGGFAFQFK